MQCLKGGEVWHRLDVANDGRGIIVVVSPLLSNAFRRSKSTNTDIRAEHACPGLGLDAGRGRGGQACRESQQLIFLAFTKFGVTDKKLSQPVIIAVEIGHGHIQCRGKVCSRGERWLWDTAQRKKAA